MPIPTRLLKTACAALLLSSLSLVAQVESMPPGQAPRTLSGTVTDHQHEPLRNAVVKLQVGETAAITTYITGPDGHYLFKRLNSGTDYHVWVSFRGHSTKHHDISKFDEHVNKVIDFTTEDY